MATCNSADSILEAANLIKSNGAKLNTFVNGTSSQTVQLGTGSPTPTLCKFIADAQSVVTQAALDAGQTVLDDVAQNTADITALQSAKADKFVPAEPGNLAKLNSEGNLRDSGWAAEDFVPLLDYANNEAEELIWQNRIAIAKYEDWLDEELDRSKRDMDEEADRHRRGMDRIADANFAAMQVRQSILDLIDAFNESYAQHRLQIRLFDGTNPTSTSKPVLFVISGQSNAVGYGAYVPFDRAVDCGQFWSWKGGANALKPLKDPTGETTSKGSGWCAFARTFFALTGRKVILVNLGRGGSAVADGTETPQYSWTANGSLRTTFGSYWSAFSAATPQDSYDIGGLLWAQGEEDAYRYYQGVETVADFVGSWEDSTTGTKGVWQWFRSLVGDLDMPIFLSVMGYSFHTSILSNPELYDAYSLFQQTQLNLIDYDSVFPGFSMAPYFIKAENLYYSDLHHYSRHGYKLQGESLARSAVHYLGL